MADAAQVTPDGKLHALGIGWTHTGSPVTAPSAVAFILHVPWSETNRKIKWTLDLIDADGKPVVCRPVRRASPRIRMEQEIEVGRPPGTKPGCVDQRAVRDDDLTDAARSRPHVRVGLDASAIASGVRRSRRGRSQQQT